MEKFVSHYTAAYYWDIPYISAIFDFDVEKDKMAFSDFTYFKREARRFVKGQRTYLCQRPLPSGAIVVKEGTSIATPELVFVQLATKLDIHRLILLALQLCAHPPGKPEEAITTKQKLKNFAVKMKGHRGASKAITAIKYAENGSASIMESLVYMMLTLPNFLGGFGFSGALFNCEINIKKESERTLLERRYFVDLYYKNAKVAVEYDSFMHHNSPYEQGKDALRAAILENSGIKVMSLSTIQLYDFNAYKNFVENLAIHLGRRVRIRTDKFEKMNSKLNGLLPRRADID